jgi:hypothetical protein
MGNSCLRVTLLGVRQHDGCGDADMKDHRLQHPLLWDEEKHRMTALGCLLDLPGCLFGEIISFLKGIWLSLYFKFQPLARIVMGVDKRVSLQIAARIASEEAGVEDRESRQLIGERLRYFDIYVEIHPTCSGGDDCRAVQVQVDLTDGHVIGSQHVPCKHFHVMFETAL